MRLIKTMKLHWGSIITPTAYLLNMSLQLERLNLLICIQIKSLNRFTYSIKNTERLYLKRIYAPVVVSSIYGVSVCDSKRSYHNETESSHHIASVFDCSW